MLRKQIMLEKAKQLPKSPGTAKTIPPPTRHLAHHGCLPQQHHLPSMHTLMYVTLKKKTLYKTLSGDNFTHVETQLLKTWLILAKAASRATEGTSHHLAQHHRSPWQHHLRRLHTHRCSVHTPMYVTRQKKTICKTLSGDNFTHVETQLLKAWPILVKAASHATDCPSHSGGNDKNHSKHPSTTDRSLSVSLNLNFHEKRATDEQACSFKQPLWGCGTQSSGPWAGPSASSWTTCFHRGGGQCPGPPPIQQTFLAPQPQMAVTNNPWRWTHNEY